ncbi:glycosyltransferase family 4 protein [Thiothrix fructosivorans]|jgi:glycosyltransferase involved in cell wall biosynthesis|uniref:Glycosyltransferase family 4 protein n=1 Tax=Thiothrix fructosivorans TaxID=111770 RepID=A0A8B0SG37_9GAMM|nr:glycosyltransferase family 4 protein [Thiothrix fructosivorans]MBO0613952.1 glycosyltransferase family 4 protein [Thiothrix fructosivorans]QTX10316.1 glycosyltransferase family 4 protein [Thiothrix fructosivorans]
MKDTRLKILEVCTVSSSAYALVFHRAQALNQRHAGQMRVDVLCSAGDEVALMQAQGMNVIVETLHRSLNPLQLLRSAWNLRRAIKQGGYDAVHLHFGVPGLVGRFLAFFDHKTVWIYQSHGYSIADNTSPLARKAYILIEKLLKKTVRYSLFQLLEDMVLAREHHLLDAEQMVFLGNGIDMRRFVPDFTARQTPTTFGMVARFEPIKNHALLLDAVELLTKQTRDFRVKLIGQGHLKANVQANIQQKGLHDVVEIVEYSNDMPAFYQSIDVGVLTSFAEGIPRALIEPMASGKPVICTDVKGSREAIIDQQTGFKTPIDSPQALADQMLWYIQHPEQRLAMGKAAREHAVKHFAETRILDILSDIYLTCHTSPVGATA